MKQHVITYVDANGARQYYTTAYTVAQIGSGVLDCEARHGWSDVKPICDPPAPKPRVKPK